MYRKQDTTTLYLRALPPLPTMSSSALMHQLFHKKRKRSRSPVSNNSYVQNSVQTSLQHRRSKQRAYYRKCRDLALEDPTIGILQRQETDSSATNVTPQRVEAFVEPWTRALPCWLLLLPLYVHVDSIAQTSFAQLLAYTRTLEKERNNLYQDYVKVQDRYRRFVQHVKARTVEWERENPKEASKENVMLTRANRSSGSETHRTSRKCKSRRVTASPNRIRVEPVRSDARLRDQVQARTVHDVALAPPHNNHDHAQSLFDEEIILTTQTSEAVPSTITSRIARHNEQQSEQSGNKDDCREIPIPTPVIQDAQESAKGSSLEDDSKTIIPPQRKVASSHSRREYVSRKHDSLLDDDSQTIVPLPPKQAPNDATANQRTTAIVVGTKDADQKGLNYSNKNVSGWISSRPAKEFVAQGVIPIESNPASRSTRPPPPASNARTWRESKPETTATSRNSYPKLPPIAPYCEVVRNKAERQTLKPHECPECGKFLDAIMEEDKEGVYNRHELMCASRHRHRFTPPDTPPDFWELSFVDERDARQQQQQQQLGIDEDSEK